MRNPLKLDYSLDYDAKCKFVEEYTEKYYLLHQKPVPPAILEELSNYLLADILLDRNPAKTSKMEYPILSAQQIKRRGNRLYCADNEEVLSYFKLAKKNRKKRTVMYD